MTLVLSSLPSKPRVVKAQIKRTKSYTESIVNGVSSLTSWVTGASSIITTQEKDIVTTAKFVEIEIVANQPFVPCLIIGYNNGFQIWDLSAANKALPDNTIVELASVQGFRVRDVYVFNRIKTNSDQEESKRGKSLLSARPLLAIVSAEDNNHEHWPNTKLQIYSIVNANFLPSLDFGAPILNVLTNERFIIVVFHDHASLLSPVSFENLFYIPLYGGDHPIGGGVASLGPRWFAYQCRQPLEDTMAATRLMSSITSTAPSTTPMDEETTMEQTGSKRKSSMSSYIPTSSDEVLWAMGNTIVDLSSSIRSISSLWPKGNSPFKVGLDVRGEGLVTKREDSLSKEVGGSVMIIDLESPHNEDKDGGEERVRHRGWSRDVNHHDFPANNFKVISHFKATVDGALSVIQFDPTGTLLATASDRGNVINIFKITPKLNDIFDSHQHIYILKRGVTPAMIKNITFSTDSKLVAVTSTPKGTSHIYGINPQGGVVDAISHLDINNQRRNVLYQYSSSGENQFSRGKSGTVEPQQPPKLAVIRATKHGSGQDQNADDTDRQFGSAVHFESRTSKDYVMFNLESNGILNFHRISLGESETNPLVLAATVLAVYEWDIRRGTKGRPYSFKLTNYQRGSSNGTSPRSSHDGNSKNNHKHWLSNIEISTCTMAHTPFWLADDLFPLQAYVSLPRVDDPRGLTDPVYQDLVYQATELVVIPTYDPNQKRPVVLDILQGEDFRPPQLLPVQQPLPVLLGLAQGPLVVQAEPGVEQDERVVGLGVINRNQGLVVPVQEQIQAPVLMQAREVQGQVQGQIQGQVHGQEDLLAHPPQQPQPQLQTEPPVLLVYPPNLRRLL